MLVRIANGKIVIKAVDDLQYVLSQIPSHVDHYRLKEPHTMQMFVKLTLNGKYPNQVSDDVALPDNKDSRPGMEKPDRPAVKRRGFPAKVRPTYTSQVVTIERQLGTCTGRQVVDEIQTKIERLEKSGFVLSGRPSENNRGMDQSI